MEMRGYAAVDQKLGRRAEHLINKANEDGQIAINLKEFQQYGIPLEIAQLAAYGAGIAFGDDNSMGYILENMSSVEVYMEDSESSESFQGQFDLNNKALLNFTFATDHTVL